MTNSISEQFVTWMKSREAAAEQRGDAAATLRAQSTIKALQAELTTARAQYGEASGKAMRLESELARARKVIAGLTGASEPPIVVEPPKVEPPASDGAPWPLQYKGMTPDQLKDVRPPGWAERRAALPERDDFDGAIDLRKEGGVLENLRLTGPNADYIQKLLSHGRGVDYRSPLPAGSDRDMLLRNIEWDPQFPGLMAQLKWWLRGYNFKNLTVEDVIARCPKGKDGISLIKEHFVYANMSGDFRMAWCLVEGFQGKPIYPAYRAAPYAQYLEDNLPGDGNQLYETASSVFLDNDQGWGKGSFNATGFDIMGDWAMSDNVFVNKWHGVREKNSDAFTGDLASGGLQAPGWLMLTSYQNRLQKEHITKTATFKNQLVSHYGNNAHPLGVIRHTKEAVFDGCLLDAWETRNNMIQIGSPERFNAGQPTPERVRVRNCDTSTGTTFEFWKQHNGRDVMRRVEIPTGSDWTVIEAEDVFA